LRRWLLTDPRLLLPMVTDDARARTELVMAQLNRQQFRAETPDESDYISSLRLQCRIERIVEGARLDRVEELFRRTTQFNATGRKFTLGELRVLTQDRAARLYAMHVSDRFGDHGLVGAVVVEKGEITGLVLSCRVLGLGVEHKLMRHVIAELEAGGVQPIARIIETSRNAPVRNIYRDNGFVRDETGLWRLPAAQSTAA
jgi:FkbH-like protein